MRRIDADALIDKYGDWYTEEGTEEGYIGTIKGIVDSMPTIEPEIIHCRDCEWWEKQEKTLQGWCCLMQMYPTGAWFCGNAQKKVDADMREDQNDQNK